MNPEFDRYLSDLKDAARRIALPGSFDVRFDLLRGDGDLSASIVVQFLPREA